MSNQQVNSVQVVNGASKLCRLAELALQFGAARIAQDAKQVGARVAEGLFYVACVGQFKRGKSTLLDALVGDRILPTGVIPVTTVPTVVRHGSRRRARVRTQAGSWSEIAVGEIEQYVSEEHNPQNTKGVAGVEVFVPSPLLASGMCFVDTPGLGSVWEANTETTREFIPHIDAAIVVIGADPPLAGDELQLVEEVSRHVHDLVFVLNKADRTSDAERAAAAAFSQRMLETRLKRPIGPIYQVSAIEQAERRGPPRDWDDFVRTLEELATMSGSRLTQAAAERGTQRICQQLLRVIEEEREALLRPFEESEHRIGLLREIVAAADRSLADLSSLFNGEQHRLSRYFEERRKSFLHRIRPVARSELANALEGINLGHGPKLRREVLRLAQEITRRHVMPWLESEQAEAEAAYAKAAQRFIDLANDFLRRMAETGLPGLAIPESAELSERLRSKSRFYFYDFIQLARPASPITYLADTIAGLLRAHSGIRNAAFEFLDLLLETNATRVQSDVDERVLESRRRLQGEIRSLLQEVARVAERALDRARATQSEGAAAVQAAISRLDAVQREVTELEQAS